jgi:hypothetical protein
VRTDDSRAATVEAILSRHKPIDALARRKEYSKAGWKGYDPAAEPYDLSEAERERIRASYRKI